MVKQTEKFGPSFKEWFFSNSEVVEKTVGLGVLIFELLYITGKVFPKKILNNESFITYFFNLAFLVIIFLYLKGDFKKKFKITKDYAEIGNILGLEPKLDAEDEIKKLSFQSNILISQLKNFNYFIISTAFLYAFLLLNIANEYISCPPNYIKNIFHFLFDFSSYLGGFFLLRCFYVMYLPTVDEKNGEEILNRKTYIYFGLVIFLMFIDIVTVTSSENPRQGRFIMEFMCGVLTAITFILLIARFENKILDIPPIILCILYLYAILQTCLPFVTEIPFFDDVFASKFKTVILTFCLIGKVTLAAIFLYILNTKRIFYYFMTLKKLHEKEEENWDTFDKLIDESPTETKVIKIVFEEIGGVKETKKHRFVEILGYPYEFSGKILKIIATRFSKNKDSSKKSVNFKYTAKIPDLFKDITGKGNTIKNAEQDLINKIKKGGKAKPSKRNKKTSTTE